MRLVDVASRRSRFSTARSLWPTHPRSISRDRTSPTCSSCPISRSPVARLPHGCSLVALPATLATALGLFVLFRRGLRQPQVSARSVRLGRLGLGLPGALAAAVLTIALQNPAIPVLVVGLVLAAVEVARGRLQWRVLFARSARSCSSACSWSVLRWESLRAPGMDRRNCSTVLGGGAPQDRCAGVGHDQQPSCGRPSLGTRFAHPRALLLGLNIGPNLAATGSLSAFLWWRAARQVNTQPSLVAFSRRGAPPRRIRDPPRTGSHDHSADRSVTAIRRKIAARPSSTLNQIHTRRATWQRRTPGAIPARSRTRRVNDGAQAPAPPGSDNAEDMQEAIEKPRNNGEHGLRRLPAQVSSAARPSSPACSSRPERRNWRPHRGLGGSVWSRWSPALSSYCAPRPPLRALACSAPSARRSPRPLRSRNIQRP